MIKKLKSRLLMSVSEWWKQVEMRLRLEQTKLLDDNILIQIAAGARQPVACMIKVRRRITTLEL